MLAQLECSPASSEALQPGQGRSCTGTHVITAQNAEAGQVTNVATVSGPQVPTNPSATLAKTASLADSNGDGSASVGELVTWTLTVTNTGDVELRNLQLTDPMITSLECTPAAAEALPVGAVRTCTAGYRVTQADVLAGAVTNTATLTGPQLPRPVPATATVPALANPSATVTKDHQLADTNGDGVGSTGEPISYLIRITNTGNVDLTGMSVGDPMLPQLECTPALGEPLSSGEVRSCTGSHVITAREAASGAVRNVVTVTARACPTSPVTTTP